MKFNNFVKIKILDENSIIDQLYIKAKNAYILLLT